MKKAFRIFYKVIIAPFLGIAMMSRTIVRSLTITYMNFKIQLKA